MKTLYKWQKIVIGIVVILTFITTFQKANFIATGLFGAIMNSAVNLAILWGLFEIGNRIYKSKKTHEKENIKIL